MGGGGVSVPGPSQEERDLQRAQKDMIDLQRQIIEGQTAQQKILLPFLAEQEGFDVTLDDKGVITGITKRPNPAQDQRDEIENLLNQRSLAALKGELPIDPGLERDLASQRNTLMESLTRQFGPGGMTSTPAQEALQRFNESENILREGARTGQLTLAEQLGITREQQNQFTNQTAQDTLRASAIGDPLTFAGAFGQVSNNYLRAQQPFIADRQMQLQASIANQQSRSSIFGAGIGALGSIGAAFFSDEDLKGDLIQISDHPIGVPVYMYTRKDTGEMMIGVLAQDVAEVMPWAVGERGGYLTVDYGELHG
jgi:hypothetical protein